MGFGALAFSLALMAAVGSLLGEFATSVVPFVIGAAFAAGAAYGMTAVSAQTALVEAMPSDARGRVIGVLASIVSAVALLTSVVAGPVADHLSAPVVVAAVGLAVAAVAVWMTRRFGPRATGSESTS